MGRAAGKRAFDFGSVQGYFRENVCKEKSQSGNIAYRGVQISKARSGAAVGHHGGKSARTGRRNRLKCARSEVETRRKRKHREHCVRKGRCRNRNCGQHRDFVNADKRFGCGNEQCSERHCADCFGLAVPRLYDARRFGEKARAQEQNRAQDGGQHRA